MTYKLTLIPAVCEVCYCKEAIIVDADRIVVTDPICPNCDMDRYNVAVQNVQQQVDDEDEVV